MARVKSLVKNTAILFIAKLSTQVVNFFLLPFYTSIFTTQEYGQIDIYTTLQMIIIPFMSLQLEMGMFRFFISSKTEDERKSIVTSALLSIAFIVVIEVLLFVMCSQFITVEYSEYLVLYYVFLANSTVLMQLCRARGDNVGYGIGSFISSSLTVLLNVFLIRRFNYRVNGVLISTIISHFLASIYLFVRSRALNYFKLKSFNFKTCKHLLKYSIPLVFNQISSWIINYSDRLIIVYFWGVSINGIYSAANKFSSITNTFFGVYNLAWTENVVRCMDDKDSKEYISNIFLLTTRIYLIVVTLIINVLPFAYKWLVKGDFVSSYPHVPILLVGLLFSGLAATVGSIYIAYNKTIDVSVTTIFSGIVNVAVHLIFLKLVHLYAASISTAISFFALYVYRYYRLKKFFVLHIESKKLVTQGLLLLASCIAYYLQIHVICLLILGLHLGYLVFFYRHNNNNLRSLIRS